MYIYIVRESILSLPAYEQEKIRRFAVDETRKTRYVTSTIIISVVYLTNVYIHLCINYIIYK